MAEDAVKNTEKAISMRLKASYIKVKGKLTPEEKQAAINAHEEVRQAILKLLVPDWNPRHQELSKGWNYKRYLTDLAFAPFSAIFPQSENVNDDMWQSPYRLKWTPDQYTVYKKKQAALLPKQNMATKYGIFPETPAFYSYIPYLTMMYGGYPKHPNLPTFNALELMKKDVEKKGYALPDFGKEGYRIPHGLDLMRSPQFNGGVQVPKGGRWKPLFTGTMGDNLEKLEGTQGDIKGKGYSPDTNGMSYTLVMKEAYNRAVISESVLIDLMLKMLKLENVIVPYNAAAKKTDNVFFHTTLGSPFHTGMVVDMVKAGYGKNGTAADRNHLLSLMKKVGGGKLQSLGTLQKQAMSAKKAELEVSARKGATIMFTIPSPKGGGEMVSFTSVKGCEGLPNDLQYVIALIAEMETKADTALQTADKAADILTKIGIVADKIGELDKKHVKLTSEKRTLDDELEKCFEQRRDLSLESTRGAEKAQECNAIKRKREEVAEERVDIAEEMVDLAREQARLGMRRQERNSLSKERTEESEANRGMTFEVTMPDGKKRKITITPSKEARSKVKDAKKKQKQTDDLANQYHASTANALKNLSENMKLTGLSFLTPVIEVVDKVVLPTLATVTPPDEEKKPFPWLLALAAVAYGTKVVPAKIALGIGAVGVAQMISAGKKALTEETP